MIQKSLVNDLPNLIMFNSNEVYEGYHCGKAHKQPFDISLSRYTFPLELIHNYIMGPTYNPTC